MFSEEYQQQIQAGFDARMARLDAQLERLRVAAGPAALSARLLAEKKRQIQQTLAACDADTAQALTFLYSAMPYSDLVDYPAALFLSYARHGVFLWQKGPFAGRVPEKLFANYVLHYRVNNEDIADTRPFFYQKLAPVVDGVAGMGQAALAVNYWCAGEGTYRSTDGRTQNPCTMYNTALGRCGEESTFAVTALRSVGIPARQVYAPLWAHCDDNHAWVELWCDGAWHFLGACEPEERLDYGWFIKPASRAMLLHSRWFGQDTPVDEAAGARGMAMVLNHTDRYAHTAQLLVRVVDEGGAPVPGARVELQLPNYGELREVAVLYTDADGAARLTAGHGDLCVSASAPGLYGEGWVTVGGGLTQDAPPTACTVTLRAAQPLWQGWRQVDFHAPVPGNKQNDLLTKEQIETRDMKLEAAAAHRAQKSRDFYDEQAAARVLARFTGEERQAVDELLHSAHGNMAELVRFLEWEGACLPANWPQGPGPDSWKLKLLQTLREKDAWDIRAEVLQDCVLAALPYADSCPPDIFFTYLVCPRVLYEMLRPCRLFLQGCLDEEQKRRVQADPACLLALLEGWLTALPDWEYEGLVTSPVGCVRGGVGDERSRQVLAVNLWRSLGIPARVEMADGRLTYYRDGAFHDVGDGPQHSARLALRGGEGVTLADWQHYSLDRFKDGRYHPVRLWGLLADGENSPERMAERQVPESLTLPLEPGVYRVMTTNRKPSGDQLLQLASLELQAGQQAELTLEMREIPLAGMLNDMPVGDADLRTLAGQATTLSALSAGGKALFLWLAVGKEPTEHILNELYEKRQAVAALSTPLYLVLAAEQDLQDPTLRRTMQALPCLQPLLGDFEKQCGLLARAVWQEPGRLPLAMVMADAHRCIYSDAGYHVGLADILCRILTAKGTDA